MSIGQMKGNTDVWQTTASVLKLRRRGRSQCIVSTTCFMDNNVSPHVKFCLWNPVSWALESRVQVKESGILPGIGIQISNSTDKNWNQVPGIRNPRHGIQKPRLSWIPLHGANVIQTRPDRKKADSLLVYAKFSHRGSVSPLNEILRLYNTMIMIITMNNTMIYLSDHQTIASQCPIARVQYIKIIT